jgi:hypothetical protein
MKHVSGRNIFVTPNAEQSSASGSKRVATYLANIAEVTGEWLLTSMCVEIRVQQAGSVSIRPAGSP